VTRGVPSRRRASAVEGYGSDDEEGEHGKITTIEAGGMEGDEEGWVAPPPAEEASALDLDLDGEEAKGGEEKEPAAATTTAAEPADPEGDDDDDEDDDEDIPDLEDLEIVDEDDIDEAALPAASVAASAAARAAKELRATAALSETSKPRNSKNATNSNVVPVRTYDLSISYDKYYQVPRFWLAGFDESKRPLSSEALLEDVAAEHARKTVTMEPHPHLSSLASSSSPKVASIHPCKHAAVMKKLVSMGAGGGEASATTKEGGGGEEAKTKTAELDPESYLVLFLKFISSVIPTIEYDFTMHASVGR